MREIPIAIPEPNISRVSSITIIPNSHCRTGRTVGYKTFQNVLHLWEGHYDSRTAQSFYNWSVIAQHFEAMRLL